jgi:hypothetical protein
MSCYLYLFECLSCSQIWITEAHSKGSLGFEAYSLHSKQPCMFWHYKMFQVHPDLLSPSCEVSFSFMEPYFPLGENDMWKQGLDTTCAHCYGGLSLLPGSIRDGARKYMYICTHVSRQCLAAVTLSLHLYCQL